ncbi:acyltransferase family protein [Dehalococcoidia bacterium]|nr:acyltransferase family protein [Dehalococcoidia bacterium]
MRRYDVDTIRVLALCVLILYHVAVGFQPWGVYIAFITNSQSLELLWKFMEVVNIWRIPILFVVSGMGVCFAMRRRNWTQLLKDRTVRIFVPYMFGIFLVVPVYWVVFNSYYDKPQFYAANPGHLWFLGNIFLYVLVLMPLFSYLNNHPESIFVRLMVRVVKLPLGVMFLFAFPLMIESLLADPDNYAAFALEPLHGLLTGMICFLFGFVSASINGVFWDAVKRMKFITFGLALLFCLIRMFEVSIPVTDVLVNRLLAFESANWMLSAFGFSATYLNKPSKVLAYLSSAVFPVYIVHLPVQFLFSSLIFPSDNPVFVKFVLVLITTYGGSLLIFEIMKRFKGVRLLFGVKV